MWCFRLVEEKNGHVKRGSILLDIISARNSRNLIPLLLLLLVIVLLVVVGVVEVILMIILLLLLLSINIYFFLSLFTSKYLLSVYKIILAFLRTLKIYYKIYYDSQNTLIVLLIYQKEFAF